MFNDTIGKRVMANRNQIIKDMSRVFTNTDPVTIQAAITDYCFNKCFMCDHYKRSNKTYIDSKTWIEFIRSLTNTKTIFYTGGDSIMHPQINDIMLEHIKLDIDFGFITSGYIPKNVNVKLLKNAKFFNVSLDSIDENTYKKLRGGIELHKILDSIDFALKNEVNVNATIIVSNENKSEVHDIVEYCYKRKMNLRLNNLYGENIDINSISNEYAEMFNENGFVISSKNETYHFSKCVVPYYSMFIDSKGDVYPCCVLGGDTEISSNVNPLGNILNFEDAKLNRIEFYKKELNKKCNNCISSFQKINNVFSNSFASRSDRISESRNFY